MKQFRPISTPFSRFDLIPECPGQTMTNGIAISVSSVAEVTAGVELPWLSCIGVNIFFFLCRILLQKYYASSWQGVRAHPTPLVCLRHCYWPRTDPQQCAHRNRPLPLQLQPRQFTNLSLVIFDVVIAYCFNKALIVVSQCILNAAQENQ